MNRDKWERRIGIALIVVSVLAIIYMITQLPVVTEGSEVEAESVEVDEQYELVDGYLTRNDARSTLPTIEFLELTDLIKAGEVITLSIGIGEGEAFTADEETVVVLFGTLQPGDIIPTLKEVYGVTTEELAVVEIIYPSPSANWGSIIFMVAPIALIFAFSIWMSRRQQAMMGGMGSSPLGRGKGRGGGERPKVTFGDVAGCDEAKAELQEVIEFLKEPEKFQALGIRVPNALLVGPPGCGKTLLARAVAGEAGVPFFPMSGSEFIEMYVGVGAKRVRELFGRARRTAPAIVFIDEIDGVGGARAGARSGGDKEYTQTLNQILAEMDGFGTDTRVFVIPATNQPDMLDSALLRPGRFDRHVVLNRPDIAGRKAILEVHVRDKPLAGDVDLADLARRTPGFVGADLENLVNEAAILAVRRERDSISVAEFRDAVERVIAGAERRVLVGETEKRIIAYHEAGHALIMHVLPRCDPVRKISIVARGMGLGYTIGTPEEDRWLTSKSELLDRIAALLGGRAAEELVFGSEDVTGGAANDLERATNLARQMVARFGMSELGLQSFTKARRGFLGSGFGEAGMAPETARLVDVEVRRILAESYEVAKAILKEGRLALDRIVGALLEEETLDREEFLVIVDR